MKAALITALAIPFLIAAPVVASAQPAPPVPGQSQSPDQMCETTQQIVNTVRAQQPDADPEQIATNYDQLMAAKVPGYQFFQQDQHKQLVDLIRACGLA